MCVFSEWNKVLSLNNVIQLIMYKPGRYAGLCRKVWLSVEGTGRCGRAEEEPGHSG